MLEMRLPMSCRRFLLIALLVVWGPAIAVLAQAPRATPPAGSKPPSGPASDVELVERLLAARRDYQVALEQLRTNYLSTGDMERARWAEEELRQYHRIPKQAYRLDLDVPPPTLQAAYNIPEANELYKEGMKYKLLAEKSRGQDAIDNERRAEMRFQEILSKYPQSDKIDDAAYQLGDIYERQYKPPQYPRAALYFERCFQWNSNTQFD